MIGEMRVSIGIDIGGTNIKGGLVRGRRILRKIEVGAGTGMVARITALIRRLISKQKVERIGIGCAGLVDPHRGVIHYSPNIDEFRNIPLAALIEEEFGIRCSILNDVNAFLLGEWLFGAGRGYQDLIGLTIGTGIGGAAIIGGRMLWGSGYLAGEFGHMVIDKKGPLCSCGRRGCLEIVASQTAIMRMARRYHLPLSDPEGVARLAKSGNKKALQIFDAIGHNLAIGIGNLIDIFDPEVVIVGGGIANAGAILFGPIRRYIRQEVMGYRYRRIRILPARLKKGASIIGAAHFDEQLLTP